MLFYFCFASKISQKQNILILSLIIVIQIFSEDIDFGM